MQPGIHQGQQGGRARDRGGGSGGHQARNHGQRQHRLAPAAAGHQDGRRVLGRGKRIQPGYRVGAGRYRGIEVHQGEEAARWIFQ